MDPATKRRYNSTYKLRKKGFIIDTKRGEISVYFRQVKSLIDNPNIIVLVREHDYEIIENRQLQLDI